MNDKYKSMNPALYNIGKLIKKHSYQLDNPLTSASTVGGDTGPFYIFDKTLVLNKNTKYIRVHISTPIGGQGHYYSGGWLGNTHDIGHFALYMNEELVEGWTEGSGNAFGGSHVMVYDKNFNVKDYINKSLRLRLLSTPYANDYYSLRPFTFYWWDGVGAPTNVSFNSFKCSLTIEEFE